MNRATPDALLFFGATSGADREQVADILSKTKNPAIFVPGVDSGIVLMGTGDGGLGPDFGPPAALHAVMASDIHDHNCALYRVMASYRNTQVAQQSVIFRTYPALVDDYSIKDRLPAVGGRLLLSGASSMRSLVKLNRLLGDDEVQKICDQARAKAEGVGMNAIRFAGPPTDAQRKLPFVIEARNFFNFYHFSTESLIYLQLYRDYALTGPIRIVTGSRAEPKPFIRNLVDDFYPDLADRVDYVADSVSHKRAIVPFNTNYLCHIFPDMMAKVETQAQLPQLSTGDDPTMPTLGSYKRIYHNSRDDYIDRHRIAMLSRVVSQDGPRRIYVGRKPGAARNRDLIGEDSLLAMLARYGFSHIYFEDLTPLQQAGLCGQVDIMISAHGAGFANMIYGKPGACFIELSHLQTARHRFGDFNMHAAAAGVNYLHFFADHSASTDGAVPNMQDGHSGIALSPDAIARLEGVLAIQSDIAAHRAFLRKLDAASKALEHRKVLDLVAEQPGYRLGCISTCRHAAEAQVALGDIAGGIRSLWAALRIAPYRRDVALQLVELAKTHDLADEHDAATRHLKEFRSLAWMRWTQNVNGASIISPAVPKPEPKTGPAATGA